MEILIIIVWITCSTASFIIGLKIDEIREILITKIKNRKR